MRKLDKWTPREASVIYWLVLWGLNNKEVTELAKDLLPRRSSDGINNYAVDARKYISELRKFDVKVKVPPTVRATLKEASKIEPVRDILPWKPTDLSSVVFRPAMNHNQPTGKKVANPIHFEQRNENEIRVEPKEEALKARIGKIKNKEVPQESFAYPAIDPRDPDYIAKTIGTHNHLLGNASTKIPCGKDLVEVGSDFDVDKMMNKLAETPFQLVNKEPSFEEVLKYAKDAGATKVCYKDYVIKFV